MPAEHIPPVILKDSLSPALDGVAASSVRAADKMLYEHSGWGIFTSYDPPNLYPSSDNTLKEANCLIHIGCNREFINWNIARFMWVKYESHDAYRFICKCGAILSKESYDVFCQVFNLLNKQ